MKSSQVSKFALNRWGGVSILYLTIENPASWGMEFGSLRWEAPFFWGLGRMQKGGVQHMLHTSKHTIHMEVELLNKENHHDKN